MAFLSDLLVGMWWSNTGMAEQAVAATVAAEPDLVLLGGDFVYSHTPDVSAQVRTVAALLEPITSSDVPVYAVMGNHDHAVGAVPELTEVLTGAGVTVLSDESQVVLGVGGDGAELHVVGLGAAWADEVADGFAPDRYGAKGNVLFVSCGIGFSTVPVRINAPPQVVLLELTPTRQTG